MLSVVMALFAPPLHHVFVLQIEWLLPRVFAAALGWNKNHGGRSGFYMN